MFKLPKLGLFVEVFKAGVIVGVFVGVAAGALAGAAGGLLTAPTSGKKLRNKIKEDTEKSVQVISENGEKLKEQGLELMGKISNKFENSPCDATKTEDSLGENHISNRYGSKTHRTA